MEKKNTGLIVALTVFIMISIMACFYIGYDKFFAKKDTKVEEKETVQKEKLEKEPEVKYQSLAVDNNKCLGDSCDEVEYSLAGDFSEGINVRVENNTAIINFYKEKLEQVYAEVFNINYTENYEIKFSENIQDVFIGTLGQDAMNQCVFFLLDDGTVEYMHIYNALKNNNIKSAGKIAGVSDIVKLTQVSVSPKNSPVGGYVSVIAQKANGEFYDLYSKVIK